MGDNLWFPKEADITIIDSTSLTLDASSSIKAQFAAVSDLAIEGYIKDISLNMNPGDASKVDTHGTDANGYQNQYMEENTPDLFELSGTLVLPKDDSVHAILSDSVTAISTTHNRYAFGKATRKKISAMFLLEDTSDYWAQAIENALLTVNNIKPTGSDGHMEWEITLKCLISKVAGPEFPV